MTPCHSFHWCSLSFGVCVHVCVGGGVQPLFPRDLRIAQFFSFKAGGASSPSSLAPTKTLDECWWYLTWSVWRTCHVTISISEFCDSLTAATVLNLSLFKTCLGTTAFSRAKKHKSIWASWTDILSYKCVCVFRFCYIVGFWYSSISCGYTKSTFQCVTMMPMFRRFLWKGHKPLVI